MNTNYELFKVLSDKNRCDILEIIFKEKEICACELLKKFDITQATFSYHMKMLKDVKLVNCYKKGTWCIYSINNDTMLMLSEYFKKMVNNND